VSAGPRYAGRAWRALCRGGLDRAWSRHLAAWSVLRDDLFFGGQRERWVDLHRRAHQGLEDELAASRREAVDRWMTAPELAGEWLRAVEEDD
jgi:hypothetical protein